MPPPLSLDVVYATDEDVVSIAGADFQVIAPPWSKFAEGKDGAFGAGDPWTLTSASNNFIAQGLRPNMIVQLLGPPTQFKGSGDLLAIESVGANSLGLRRPGEDSSVGLPPGPAAGITSVAFVVTSLRRQLEDTAYLLNQRFSVDPALGGRTPDDVYNVRLFRLLTVYQVLLRQYSQLNRSQKGDFADKVEYYKTAFDNEMATATVQWGTTSAAQSQQRTSRLER